MFLLISCLIALSLADPCPQGAVYNDHLNICYIFSSTPHSFEDAQSNCLSLGGQLAKVTSAFDESAIAANAAGKLSADYWIGGRFDGSVWQWTDQSAFTYTKWAPGQPASTATAQCVSMQVTGGKWQADECESGKPSVCQVPSSTVCEHGWKYLSYTQSCYYGVTGRQAYEFNDAELFCQSQAAHMASIHSATEYSFVNEVSGYFYGWSSIHWNGTEWVNTDGSPIDYGWSADRPAPIDHNDCLYIGDRDALFTPDYEDTFRQVACKKPANKGIN